MDLQLLKSKTLQLKLDGVCRHVNLEKLTLEGRKVQDMNELNDKLLLLQVFRDNDVNGRMSVIDALDLVCDLVALILVLVECLELEAVHYFDG